MGKRTSFLSYLYSIGFLFLFLFTFAFTLFKTLDSQSNELFSFTSLTQTESWGEAALQFQNKPLVAGQNLSAEFTAQYSNLGTVGILFENFDRQNSSIVTVRLANLTTSTVVYENTYSTEKMSPDYFYTLGWPMLRDSRGQKYRLELISQDGTATNSVGLASAPHFIAKYVYPVQSLKSDPPLAGEFLWQKASVVFHAALTIPIWFYAGWLVAYFLLPILWFRVVWKPDYSGLDGLGRALLPFSPFLMFMITFLVAGYFAAFDPDMHHDGIVLKPAMDVAQGKMLFRDTFTQYGALTTILQAGVLKIFGETLYALRIFTALVYAVIAALCFFIGKRFLTHWQLWLSFFVWLLLAPYLFGVLLAWSSVYALLFQLVALLFVQKYTEKQRPLFLVMAGANTALAFWAKQNVGLYTILGLGLSFLLISALRKTSILEFIRHGLWITFGGLAATAPIALWIVFNNATLDWFKQTFLHSLYWARMMGNANGFYASMFPRSESLVSIWAIIPITVIAVLCRAVLLKKPPLALIVTAIFGLTSWLQYFPMSDPLHTYWAATPMIGIFVYFFYEFIRIYDGEKRAGKTAAFLFSTLLIVFLSYPDIRSRLHLARSRMFVSRTTVENPVLMKHMKLTSAEAKMYQSFGESIERYQAKYGKTSVVTITEHGLFAALAQPADFHPLPVDWPSTNAIYPEYLDKQREYIEAKRPLIAGCGDHKNMPSYYCPISEPTGNTCIRIFADCERPL